MMKKTDPFQGTSLKLKTDKSNEEDNTPLKIFTIRKQKPKSIYELKSEELRRWLRPINDYEVAVIPIVGPSRLGKSFILNYMCRYLANSNKPDWLGRKTAPLKGFHWKSETLPQTDGIWISKPYILEKSNGKQIAVLLLDTQGVFDQKTNKRDWSTIVGLSLLISSCLIFNISQILQEDALIFLESFLDYGLRASKSFPNLQEEKAFQNMLFLIRDWAVISKHKYGLSGGQEYLDDKLQLEDDQEDSAKHSRELLKDCFSEVECFLMPKLGDRSDEAGFDGSVAQLSPEFSRKLKELVVHILNPDEIKAKKMGDKAITGAEVCQLMESFVNVFNSSAFDAPPHKELFGAYSRISDQINLRRNKILHLSLLESKVQSKPFLPRNALVEMCGQINDEISNIFHEELITNDDKKWEFIEEMDASFEDNFNTVYTQNEIRRKEYITEAVEVCKQLFVELTQKDSEQTNSLNLLAFDEYLKQCEKTVCERFESYYMGEEKNLFLKDLIDLKEVMSTRKESMKQVQIKQLDESEGMKAELVDKCLQLYSFELQNLLDTNTFIESQMFKEFEDKIRAHTIETFKENFKFENTRTNQFFLLDLEKKIKGKKKHFKKMNEKKCHEIIENTEELLRKAVKDYEKNIIQWVDVCDNTHDLLKRHNMAKNESTEQLVNKCLYTEESFLNPFLNRLDNEIIKIHTNYESVVNSKNSIYEKGFHLSIINYENQMKSVLEMNRLPNENQLEKSNKAWMKEAKSLYLEQFKTSNPSQNLFYRFQNELNNKMEDLFDNFVEEVKEREKQMETKIHTISQKMLTKFSRKMKNVIQYVRTDEELNYKLNEIKEELLSDFVEKLEFTDESLLESNKNDLNELMDIEFDKIKQHLESRREEIENSFQTGVFQYSDKYVQKMTEFSKTQDFYNEIILSTFHQNLKINLIICFKKEFKSILNISAEEYESNLKKLIENEFNDFVQKRLNKISKFNDSINELDLIYLDKMEKELNCAQDQIYFENKHLTNKAQILFEFCKQNQSVPQSFLTDYKSKLEDQIDKSYDQLLAKLLQREEDFKKTFDDKIDDIVNNYCEDFNQYLSNGQFYETDQIYDKERQIKRKSISDMEIFSRTQPNFNVDPKGYLVKLEIKLDDKFKTFLTINASNRVTSVDGLNEEYKRILDNYNMEMKAICDSITSETELNAKHNLIKNRVISDLDIKRFKDESEVVPYKENLNKVLNLVLSQYEHEVKNKINEKYKLQLINLKKDYTDKMNHFFNTKNIITDMNLKEKHDQLNDELSLTFSNKYEEQFNLNLQTYLSKLSDILSDEFKEYQDRNKSRIIEEANSMITELTEKYVTAIDNFVDEIEDQTELNSKHMELKTNALHVFEGLAEDLGQYNKAEKDNFLAQLDANTDENFKKTITIKKPIIENLKLKASLFYQDEMNKYLDKEGFMDNDMLVKLHHKTMEMARAKFENEFQTLNRQHFLRILEKSVRIVFEKIEENNQLYRPKSTHAIGIDLGTTNSCVSYFKPDANNKYNVMIIPNEFGRATTASVVSIRDNEEVVGDAAKEETFAYPRNTIFSAKRLIGRKFQDDVIQNNLDKWSYEVIDDGSDNPQIKVQVNHEEKKFYAEQISSRVLKKLKDIAQKHLGCEVTKAVITVPAYFNEAQKEATKDAGKMAGLDVMRIINEPTAAAIAYRLNWTINSEPRKVLIYDFGGGTFDVAVLVISKGEIDVRAVGGDNNLGGDDFDTNLIDFCINEFCKLFEVKMVGDEKEKAISRLRLECEKCKIKLAGVEKTKITIRNFYENHNLDIDMNRKLFEELNESLIQKSMDLVIKTLTEAEMTTTDIDDIVLVGGSTRILRIQERLQELFDGKPLNHSVNPDEAVAVGAAIQAALLNEKQSVPLGELVLSDVAPLSLGIEVLGGKFSKIIAKNTKVPTTKTDNYTTTEDNQKSVKIQIYEGENPIAKKNNLLGTFTLNDIPPAPEGTHVILVTFDVTSEGILNVKARIEGTGQEKDITITEHRGRPKIF